MIAVGPAIDSTGRLDRQYDILQPCEVPNILELAYCLIYCLFWSLSRGYFIDLRDWIDSALGM